MPLNYGASLYQTEFTTDASPSSPSSPTHLTKSGTIHDARLRSWLQRRKKTLEKPGKPKTSTSERLVVGNYHGSNALHLPFKWVPIQARELASNDVYFRGIHVNSLSLLLKPGPDGPDVDWNIMEMKSTGCQELGAIHCCIVGNKMIFCRGLVQCDESKAQRILQLPTSMRPNGTLTFAVLCSQREDESGDASNCLSLGRMKVFPDGWICIESVPPRCVVDLSGIRFAKGGGLPLTESVQVFSCSLRSQHLVMLQGKVSEKFFDIWPGNPLVQIPPDFRPPEKCPFVVPGGRSGGFHLLQIGPSSSGGYIEWSDSVWNRDEIEVTAVSYETDSNVDCLPGALINSWSTARRGIVRDPAVRLGSFGFKKVKKNLKAARVVSVPLRFGSSRFKKRFGSMSAFRVLPESNSNLAISFQLWHDFFRTSLAVLVFGCLAGYLGWLAVNVSF